MLGVKHSKALAAQPSMLRNSYVIITLFLVTFDSVYLESMA